MGDAMLVREKVWPIVYRQVDDSLEVLAFRHPSTGNQFVKGTIEPGEAPLAAAIRELREESGLTLKAAPRYLGRAPIGAPPVPGHFYAMHADASLPPAWDFQTEDDLGHVFSFFWHPLARAPDHEWHPIFHEAWQVVRERL